MILHFPPPPNCSDDEWVKMCAHESRGFQQRLYNEYAEMSKKDTNPKDAVGCKKPPLSVIPCPVLFEIGAAMLEGACKYRRHNYRVAGVRLSVYYDAAMRHLMQWWEGEDIDPDSGVHHISKAIAGLIVVRDAMMRGMTTDDRPPKFDEDPNHKHWLTEIQGLVDDVLKRHPNPLPPYTAEGEE